MKITDAAVQAAMDATEGNIPPIMLERALTAAMPFLQGMKVKDLSALERLAKLAESFDLPDGNGPFPDIQDVMVTVGDLRKARKLFSELSAIEPSPSPLGQALEEAAKWLDDWSEKTWGQDVSPEYAAAAIRALKSQPAQT